MKKILLVFLLLVNVLFAVDAKLEIVKKATSLPKIAISVSPKAMNLPLTNKVRNMIAKDFEVSGHFNVDDKVYNSDFNSSPDMIRLSNSGKIGRASCRERVYAPV